MKYKVGDIVESYKNHIKPNYNGITTIIKVIKGHPNSYYVFYPKLMLRAGSGFVEDNKLITTCVWVQMSRKIGVNNSKLIKILYGN